MGCGPAQPEAPDARNGKQALVIYGDYFSADTRALVAMCKMAGIEHTLEVVDTLDGANQHEDYLRRNPTGAVPMLSVGNNNVISQG